MKFEKRVHIICLLIICATTTTTTHCDTKDANNDLNIFLNSLKRITRDDKLENDIFENKCGQRFYNISKPLIVNGENAKYGEFPWHVAIYLKESNDLEPMYICAGSIISQTSVLSVAHCFTHEDGTKLNGSEFYVIAGKFYSSFNFPVENLAQKKRVANVIIHPQYKGVLSHYAWDIAIVELEESFILSDVVQPVCVDLKSEFEDEQLTTNNIGEVAGWGLTEANFNTFDDQKPSKELKILRVPFIDHNNCYELLPQKFKRNLTPDKICAGYLNGSSVCTGDSGGGLVFEKTEGTETRYFIRGLISAGVQNGSFCDNNQLSLYTKVSSHLAFFQDYVQNVCITPNGQLARCISLQKCKLFVDTLTNANTTAEMYNFISDSECGYSEKPLVCCGSVVTYQNRTTHKESVIFSKSEQFKHKNLKLLPSNNECGIQNYQYNTLGGNVAGIDEYPWVVRLFYDRHPTGFRCIGVLINDRYVLTATDCILRTNYHQFNVFRRVWLGEYNSKTTIDCVNSTDPAGKNTTEICNQPVKIVEVEKIIFNEKFRQKDADFVNFTRQVNQRYDIGLLRLAERVTFTEFIKPICLPLRGETTPAGQYLHITGWETLSSSKKQVLSVDDLYPLKLKTKIMTIDYDQCNQYYKTKRNYPLIPSQMCAGGTGSVDTCQEDAGGPAMNIIPNTMQYYVESIVTFGIQRRYCGSIGDPRIFTRVSDYLEWILDNLEP